MNYYRVLRTGSGVVRRWATDGWDVARAGWKAELGIEETACQLLVNAERLEEWVEELGLFHEPKESVATEFVELSPMPWGCVRRMPGRGGRIRRAGSSASRSRAGRWPSWLACCRRCAAERRHRDPVQCGFSCDVALHSRGWTRGAGTLFRGEDLKNTPVMNCTVQSHGDLSTLSGAKVMNWKRR